MRINFFDNGIGISKNNLNKIFTSFYTTKRPGLGTGLGLSISYSIIKEHQGIIQVESIENKWTLFTINLPAL